MLEPFVVALTAFFATVAPVDVAVLFAALSGRATEPHRLRMAIKARICCCWMPSRKGKSIDAQFRTE